MPITHAPHHDSGRAMCGAEWKLKTLRQRPTCPGCIEQMMEHAEELAAFELASSGYYAEIGNVKEAAQCVVNSAAYTAEARELREQLTAAREAARLALLHGGDAEVRAAMRGLSNAINACNQTPAA